MATHPVVEKVVSGYLRLVDSQAPGLVNGLYLVGSVALDDFCPHISDIDFIAVTRRTVSPEDLLALRRVHTLLAARHRRPHFDGAYVTWRDLTANPALAAPGADSHEGRLRPRDAGRCDPLAWHSLAFHGVAVRGPHRRDIAVRTDRDGLAAWTRQNLDDYWQSWLRRSSRLLSTSGLACVLAWGPAWGVLGVPRLHYTLATGDITSKTGAGQYARETFGRRWHRIIDECLRIRHTGGTRHTGGGRSLYRDPLARRRDALDFVTMAIEDAHRIG